MIGLSAAARIESVAAETAKPPNDHVLLSDEDLQRVMQENVRDVLDEELGEDLLDDGPRDLCSSPTSAYVETGNTLLPVFLDGRPCQCERLRWQPLPPHTSRFRQMYGLRRTARQSIGQNGPSILSQQELSPPHAAYQRWFSVGRVRH